MTNWDINDMESAYNQDEKKIEETNEGFSNPPHPLSFHQTTFKYENATNARTTPFNCALHKK